MNNLQKCLAANMKKYRKLRGFSQEKLAEQAGTSANYIALIESGKNFPSLPMICQIAAALEIDELELFNVAGIKYENFQKMHKELSCDILHVIDKYFERLY